MTEQTREHAAKIFTAAITEKSGGSLGIFKNDSLRQFADLALKAALIFEESADRIEMASDDIIEYLIK